MSFMGKLNDAGQAKLDGYLKMLQDKDYLPAIKGISMVSRIFGTLSCAKAAATALDKAANDPDTKDVVAKVKADELAEAKAHAAAVVAPAPTTAPSTSAGRLPPAGRHAPLRPSRPTRRNSSLAVAAKDTPADAQTPNPSVSAIFVASSSCVKGLVT